MPKRKKPDDDDEDERVVVLFADHFREEVTPHPVSDDDTCEPTQVVRGQIGTVLCVEYSTKGGYNDDIINVNILKV